MGGIGSYGGNLKQRDKLQFMIAKRIFYGIIKEKGRFYGDFIF
jgi:hypothetical protein